jgi:cysteinyl-tRNA synthetase
LLALREVAKKASLALGLFEDKPSEWLLRRRDRQVARLNIDVSKVDAAIKARHDARAAKNFQEADRIRTELKAMRVEIMDTPAGTTWKVFSELPTS